MGWICASGTAQTKTRRWDHRRVSFTASILLDADQLDLELHSHVRRERGARVGTVGLIRRQGDFPLRACRHLQQGLAHGLHFDFADLDRRDLLGRAGFGRALAVRERTGHFQLHGAGLGRLGTLAGFDHAVLDAARQGLHAGLGLVRCDELITLGLVFGSGLFVLGLGGLGTALLALLERFNGRLQLLGGDRRLLLGVGVLQALHHRS
ncbi:hypothetical protein G6F68_014584 [Rhizopus microsporus]|nr:hypothetical protein G6F68_014584 [Rhizopus microsporus]